MNQDLMLYIVGAFLLLNLIIGYFAGRNVKDFNDYAIGNKRWSTGAIVMTYLATIFGGGTLLRDSFETFNYGSIVTLGFAGSSFGHIIRAYLFAPNMHYFADCSTTGSVVNKLYGKYPQIFTGLASTTFSIFTTSIQIKALSMVFTIFLNTDSFCSLVMSGLVMTAYTAFGGMKAVVATDMLQFILLFGALLVLAIYSVEEVGGFYEMIEKIKIVRSNSDFFDFKSKDIQYYIALFITGALFQADIVYPARMPRMLINLNGLQFKKTTILNGIGQLTGNIIIALIALSAILIVPEAKSGADIFMNICNNILPQSLLPFVMIGLIALILSSGDSQIHSGGVSFLKDFLQPVFKIEPTLKAVRYTVFIIGLLSIFMAIYGSFIFGNIEFLHATIMPVLSVPVFLGFIGLKNSTKNFWISGIFASFTYFCVKYFFTELGPYALLISLFTNFIIFLVTKYYDDGRKLIYFLKNKYNTIDVKKLVTFFESSNYKEVGAYDSSIIFLIILLNLPYMIGNSKQNIVLSNNILFVIKGIGTILCTLLLTKSIWPSFFKKYIHNFWLFLLGYCLCFVAAINIIFSEFEISLFGYNIIQLFMLFTLLDTFSAIIISLLGYSLGFFICSYLLDVPICLNKLSISQDYDLVQQVVVSLGVILIFVHKRSLTLSKITNLTTFLKFINKATIDRNQKSLQILRDAKDSFKDFKKDPQENVKKILEALELNNLVEAKCQTLELKAYLKANEEELKPYCVLDVDKVEVYKFLEDCRDMASYLNLENLTIILKSKIKYIHCDEAGLKKFIWKSLNDYINLKKSIYSDDYYVTLTFSDTKILYGSPSDTNYVKILPSYSLTISEDENSHNDVFKESYFVDLIDPEKIPSIGFLDNEAEDIKNIIVAHYGSVNYDYSENNYFSQAVLPVNVNEIRPVTLDLTAPKHYKYEWPDALVLENKFELTVNQKLPLVSQERLTNAIEIIKKYHSHQIRKSGEPYYLHPINVALICVDIISDKNSAIHDFLYKEQENIVLAALMHDVLEDTAMTALALRNIFNDKVLDYISEVTKIKYGERAKILNNEEAFAKLIDQEPAVICIKIADRIHNLETIDGHPKVEKRIAVAEETLLFFVRPAQKYGMENIAKKIIAMCNYIIKNGKIEGHRH